MEALNIPEEILNESEQNRESYFKHIEEKYKEFNGGIVNIDFMRMLRQCLALEDNEAALETPGKNSGKGIVFVEGDGRNNNPDNDGEQSAFGNSTQKRLQELNL